MSYAEFLSRKRRVVFGNGMAVTSGDVNPMLFDFQRAIVAWAVKKGRAAVWADTGLGKTFMQLEWARITSCRTLIFAPLCVAEQTAGEALKLGMTLRYARNEAEATDAEYVITNYERLDDFDLSDYGAVVLDESSILKAFDGKTRGRLIEACKRVPYRLCCTATPSPNDIAELANHAEFLGLMKNSEFLATWFVKDSNSNQYRLKGHARQPFFRWLASWAISIKKPSDIGFDDGDYELPPLHVHDHVIDVDGPVAGCLFPEMGTKGLSGRLSARRASLEDRVATAAHLVGADLGHGDCQWMIWCGLNEESDGLYQAIPQSVAVAGSDTYAEKVGAVQGFLNGSVRHLVSKAKILGFGMNFQHCHHQAFVGMSDSYEAYYQCVRRSWRFGQTQPVHAHVIFSEAEKVVIENVRRKEAAARELSVELVAQMSDFEREELIAV